MFFDGNEFAFGIPNDVNEYYEYGLNDKKTVSSKEGFLKGNLFSLEYEPYKNMTYFDIKPKDEKEGLLYKIMEVNFAINDLNLYLDLHPEDSTMYEEFKMYTKKCIELTDEYSKKYGPLTLDETNGNTYNWIDNPWPWDNEGGSMYV